MSKVFVKGRKFHFIREIVRHDGYWDFLFAVCQCWYQLFCLLRFANLAIGRIDKVEYYVCQMDRLLHCGLRNLLMKWNSVNCPYYKILLSSTRKIDSRMMDGSAKREGLNDADVEDDEDEGRCFFFMLLFAWLTQLLLNCSI